MEIYNRNVRYQEGLFQDLIQDKLDAAGLLETAQDESDQEVTGDKPIQPESGKATDDGGKDDGVQQEPAPCEVESIHGDVSSRELAWRTAYQEFTQRAAEYQEMKEEFDRKNEACDKQRECLKQRIREGAASRTLTEFDQDAFLAIQQITRDFAAAEEAFEEAMARRKEFGSNDDGRESGFLEDEYDGYPLSWEDDAIHSAPLTKINNWLSGLPDIEITPEALALHQGAGLEFGRNEPGILDDCDIRSAGMTNAWSSYDWTQNRRRIDHWRQIAGRTR